MLEGTHRRDLYETKWICLRSVKTPVPRETALTAYRWLYFVRVQLRSCIMQQLSSLRTFKVQKKCVWATCGTWFADSCKLLVTKLTRTYSHCHAYTRDICVHVNTYPHLFKTRGEVIQSQIRQLAKLKLSSMSFNDVQDRFNLLF